MLIILSVAPVWAQVPFFKSHEFGEQFQKAKAELIFEDENSALWLGTTQGLFLYDGIEFHPILKEDATSNHVRSVFRDSKSRFWVGYEDGSIYHFHNQQLRAWQPEEGLPRVAVNGFAEDGRGHIWFSTYGEGVYLFDEKRVYNFNQEDGLPGNDIYTLVAGQHGKIWVGTDRGLSHCDFFEENKVVENFSVEDGLPDNIVKAVLADDQGRLWVGTYDGGVCLFDPGTKSFTYPLPQTSFGVVNCLELFAGTDLWIGTAGQGIWRFNLTNKELTPLPKLENTKVADLHKDIEGNIWVLTSNHGIHSANRQFEFVETDFKNTQAVLCDSGNRLWAGTSDGLFVHRVDEKGNSRFQQHLPSLKLNIVSLFEDDFANIWIGTFGAGVYIYQPDNGKVFHLTVENGLKDGNIFSMDGQDGVVWLATFGGVLEVRYDGDVLKGGNMAFRSLDKTTGLGSNFIYKVFIDSRQRVWFGTDGQGLSVLDHGVLKNFSHATHVHTDSLREEDFRLHAVYSITEDQQGHIWLSTDKAGIFEFDGENFLHLTVKEGVRDVEITSLATDANGQILIVHPTGIDLLDPSSKHLIYYDNEVGVSRLDPNLNAVCTDPYGNIWIAGNNKIIKYTSLKDSLEIHPRTLLNNVFVFLEPVDFRSVHSFASHENHLIFSYMGLWYTDPQIVKYRYRMKGYDLSWIESKDRRATYSNLPPGQYTFEVTSTENDAWSDEPVVSYQFKIRSPIWRRWWFIVLLLASVGSFFYWYQKSRDKRVQLVNLLEKDRAESELAALKAQINPHFLFNSFNTLISVIEENPQLAVEYVDNLSDFYRKIMQLRDKELIPIQEEIELLHNYNFLLKKRYGNNFHLNIDVKEGQFYIVPFTLQILVENAVKHNVISKSKPLTVDIRMEGDRYIVVSNAIQPKLTKEKSTRFGLQSIVQGYRLLGNKKVKVEDQAGVFIVSIPVID